MKYSHVIYKQDKLKNFSQIINKYNIKEFTDKLESIYDKLHLPAFPFVYCSLYEVNSMEFGIAKSSDESDLLLEMIFNSEVKYHNNFATVKTDKPELKYAPELPLVIFANNLSVSKRNALSNYILEKGNVLENVVFATKVNLPIYQKIKHKYLVKEKGNGSENCLYLIFNHDASIYEHYKNIYSNSGDLKMAKMAQILIQGYYGVNQTEIEEYAKYKMAVSRLSNASNKKAVQEQLKDRQKAYETAKEKEDKFISGIQKHF